MTLLPLCTRRQVRSCYGFAMLCKEDCYWVPDTELYIELITGVMIMQVIFRMIRVAMNNYGGNDNDDTIMIMALVIIMIRIMIMIIVLCCR